MKNYYLKTICLVISITALYIFSKLIKIQQSIATVWQYIKKCKIKIYIN